MSTAVRSVAWRLSVEGDQLAVQKLQATGSAARKAVEPVSPALLAVSAASKELQGGLSGLAQEAGGVGTVLAAMGPVGLGLAVVFGTLALAAHKAFEGTREAEEFADQLQQTAQHLRLNVEYFQALVAAGKDYNITQAQMVSGMGALRDNVSQFIAGVSGRGGPSRVFKDLGISREDLANAGSFQNQISLIVQALSRIQNIDVREGLAGKLGLNDLLPLLNGGAAALKKLTDGAAESGLVLDSDVVKRLADANRESEKLSEQISKNWREALAGLAPVMLQTKEFFAEISALASKAIQSFMPMESQSSDFLQSRLSSLNSYIDTINTKIKQASEGGIFSQLGVGILTKRLAAVQDERARIQAELAHRAYVNGPPPLTKSGPLPPSAADEQETARMQAAMEQAQAQAQAEMAKMQTLAQKRQQFFDQVAVNAAQSVADRVGAEDAADVEILRNKEGYYKALAKQADDARDAEIARIEAQTKAQLDALDKLKAEYEREGDTLTGYQEKRDAILRSGNDQADAARARDRAQQVSIAREAAGSLVQLAETINGPLQKALQDVGANELDRFTDDLLAVATGAKGAGAAVSDMVNSIIADIGRLVLQRNVEAPLAGALNTAIGSWFGGGHATGGGARAGVTYRVNEQGGMPETYFTAAGDGYVLSSPSSLDNMVQLVSRRLSTPTVIVPSTPPKVEVHNHGEPMDVSQTYDSGTNTTRIDLKKQLRDANATAVRRGDLDAAMSDRFGAKPLPRRRN